MVIMATVIDIKMPNLSLRYGDPETWESAMVIVQKVQDSLFEYADSLVHDLDEEFGDRNVSFYVS